MKGIVQTPLWQAWGIDHLSRNLFQCLTTLPGKKCFFMFNLNLFWCCFESSRRTLVYPLGTREKRSAFHLHFPSSGSCRVTTTTLSLLFSKPGKPGVLSCFSQDTAFTSPDFLLWMLLQSSELHNIPGEATPALTTAGSSPLFALCLVHGRLLPSWLPGTLPDYTSIWRERENAAEGKHGAI